MADQIADVERPMSGTGVRREQGSAFQRGASPTRQPRQPEAAGAAIGGDEVDPMQARRAEVTVSVSTFPPAHRRYSDGSPDNEPAARRIQ